MYHIYWKMCKYYGISNYEKCYKKLPDPITEAKGGTNHRDFSIQTDRKIKNNRTYLLVKNNKNKHTF